MFRFIIGSLILIISVVTVVGSIILLGNLAREDLARPVNNSVSFASIQCVSPPGMKQIDFLDEVQYMSSLPAELNMSDEKLPDRLAEAFSKHPWVAKVAKVDVAGRSHIHVELELRRPVLVVQWNGAKRVVDGEGILLPSGTSSTGLPAFAGIPSRPNGPAGTAWPDAKVVAAAKRAASNTKNSNQ